MWRVSLLICDALLATAVEKLTSLWLSPGSAVYLGYRGLDFVDLEGAISVFDIKEELKKLPEQPGVYIMKEGDTILYVGKAVNLKNRVRQYFQSPKNKTAKILRMISRIEYFEYIVTDTEMEALILENNLIKEHRHPYYTLLMDDKQYP